MHATNTLDVLRAFLELEAELLLGVEDERCVAELDELNALDGGVGRCASHDCGDEVPRFDFVEKGVLVF